jgi:hypothetical protein
MPAPRFPFSFGGVVRGEQMTPAEALRRVARGLDSLRRCEFTSTPWGLAFRIVWLGGFYTRWNPLAGVSGGHLHAEGVGDGVAVHYVIRTSPVQAIWLAFVWSVLLVLGGALPAFLVLTVVGFLSLIGGAAKRSDLDYRLRQALDRPLTR